MEEKIIQIAVQNTGECTILYALTDRGHILIKRDPWDDDAFWEEVPTSAIIDALLEDN